MNIWESLAADPQVEIGVSKHNGAYRDFIEQELPQVLAEMKDRLLTIKTLMEAQYLCADRLAHHLHLSEVGPVLKSIASGLSQYENADVFLWAIGIEEEAYWKKRPGVSATEFSEIRLIPLTPVSLHLVLCRALEAAIFRCGIHEGGRV